MFKHMQTNPCLFATQIACAQFRPESQTLTVLWKWRSLQSCPHLRKGVRSNCGRRDARDCQTELLLRCRALLPTSACRSCPIVVYAFPSEPSSRYTLARSSADRYCSDLVRPLLLSSQLGILLVWQLSCCATKVPLTHARNLEVC